MIALFSAPSSLALALGLTVVASLLAPPAAPAAPPTPAPAAGKQPSAEETAKREAWRTTMSRTPLPRKGCFKSTFPNTEWQEVPCVTPPPHPYTVGNGNTYAAQSSGTISSATGYFPYTDATSESGNIFDLQSQSCKIVSSDFPNVFSLQLNTSNFTTSACSQSTNNQCRGLQQFIHSNSRCSGGGGCIFIQYRLQNYINPAGSSQCPNGWIQDTSGAGLTCYKNSSGGPQIPIGTIADLENLHLTGKVQAGVDQAILDTGNELYTVQGDNSLPELAQKWNGAEFNVLGDSCGSQAKFNDGATIHVNLWFEDGTFQAPICGKSSNLLKIFSTETNNLNLLDFGCSTSAVPPGIDFWQSNAPPSPPTPGCTPLGQACNRNAQPFCCAPAVCFNAVQPTSNNGTCTPPGGPGQHCVGPGNHCPGSGNIDCCSGWECDGGRCLRAR
jgi:hypothetical protein